MTQQSQTGVEGLEDSWGGGHPASVHAGNQGSDASEEGQRKKEQMHSAARNESGQAKAVLLFFEYC